MLSRKKIISRSRDDINLLANGIPDDSEDVWYHKEKLFKDHIQEILQKWNQIDDEIWGKVIIFEKNRRVAKAYARHPVLTINGSNSEFDGSRIGLSKFENPLRDKRTQECRNHIGNGVKLKMDESGNILIKRLSRSNIYIKRTITDNECAISNDILKHPHYAIDANKQYTLFDMKKFQSNVISELKKSYPNRRSLENQCLSVIAFVKNENELLKCPIWVMVVNLVAIEMLKMQIPFDPIPNIKTRAPIPAPPAATAHVAGEETYSVCGNAKIISGSRYSQENFRSSISNISNYGSNNHIEKIDNPPKLPPRKQMESCNIPQPDYDQELRAAASSIKRIPSKKRKDKKEKLKNKQKMDDPYYCGFRARIPNFVAKLTGKNHRQPQHKEVETNNNRLYQQNNQPIYGYTPSVMEQHIRRISQVKYPNMVPPQQPHSLWHAKSLDSGLDHSISSQSPYNPYTMYYRFQAQPSRGYIPLAPGNVYIGEWD